MEDELYRTTQRWARIRPSSSLAWRCERYSTPPPPPQRPGYDAPGGRGALPLRSALYAGSPYHGGALLRLAAGAAALLLQFLRVELEFPARSAKVMALRREALDRRLRAVVAAVERERALLLASGGGGGGGGGGGCGGGGEGDNDVAEAIAEVALLGRKCDARAGEWGVAPMRLLLPPQGAVAVAAAEPKQLVLAGTAAAAALVLLLILARRRR